MTTVGKLLAHDKGSPNKKEGFNSFVKVIFGGGLGEKVEGDLVCKMKRS